MSAAKRSAFIVIGLALVALGLRVVLMDESYFGDELFTNEISTRPSLRAVLSGVRSTLEITPPLFFVVTWVAAKLGDPLVWLRIPSLLAGVALVPLVYVLGLRTVGRPAGLAASAFMALSPFAIYYSTEARTYALMTLIVLLSTLSLLKALETGERRWWLALGLLDAAALYSHYTALFVVGAQGLWALWSARERWRPLVATHVGAAVAYIPWIPFLREDADAPNQKIVTATQPFTLENTGLALGRWFDGASHTELTSLPGTLALVLLGAAAALGLGGLVWRLRGGVNLLAHRHAVLVGLLAIAAPAGCAAYSVVGEDLFIPRNLASSLPALCLALGALVVALPRRAAALALALALAAFAIGAVKVLDQDNRRPPYREVAAFLEANLQPGDPVLDLSPFPGPPGQALDLNLDHRGEVYKLGFPGEGERAVRAARGRRLGYVQPLLEFFIGADPPLGDSGLEPVKEQTFAGSFPLRVVIYGPPTL